MKTLVTLLSYLTIYLVLIIVPKTLHAQIPDSCLRMLVPDDPAHGALNPDSTLIDSCVGSPTYNKWFGRKSFFVSFSQTIVFLPWAKEDTIIEFSWQSIDTSFSDIRTAFQQLENQFGTFWLRKAYPNDTSVNSGRNSIYYIRLAKYAQVDPVVSILLSIPLVKYSYYESHHGYPNNVLEKREIGTGQRSRYLEHCTSIIPQNGILPVPEIARRKGWQLVNIIGQTVRSYEGESLDETVNLSTIHSGVYFAIFPTCTTLIIFLGDTK